MSTQPAATHFEEAATRRMEPFAIRYTRIAIGASFLCAVADRFGLLGQYGGWGNMAVFTSYTAKVLSFLPAATIPFFAWSATLCETLFGLTLALYGVLPARHVSRSAWPRWIAFGSSALLLLFAIAMSISLGPVKPLDYSVFSASAGALLLGLAPDRQPTTNH